MWVCVCHDASMEVRGQLVGLSYHVSPEDQLSVVRLGGKFPYLQTHLAHSCCLQQRLMHIWKNVSSLSKLSLITGPSFSYLPCCLVLLAGPYLTLEALLPPTVLWKVLMFNLVILKIASPSSENSS